MGDVKGIVLSQGPTAPLSRHVAGLDLARRALSTPLTTEAAESGPAFVELWGAEATLRSLVASWPFAARAWLVREHAPMAYARTWPSGSPSPGVRMVSALHRHPEITRAAFEAHWLGPHTRVAKSYTVPVWHYNQNVVVEALTEHDGEDGFVGMHFETRAQFEARWADYPEEAARGAEDAARFMDGSRSVSLLTQETVWERTGNDEKEVAEESVAGDT